MWTLSSIFQNDQFAALYRSSWILNRTFLEALKGLTDTKPKTEREQFLMVEIGRFLWL